MSTVGFDPMVLKCGDHAFDTRSAKTKQFYKLLLTTKAKLPNMSKRLIADFGVEDMLDKIYLLPHFVASETYIWSFQYQLLNYILFTNVKLLKIGFALTDKCTFSNSYEETFYHLFFECSHVQAFWQRFVNWWADAADEKSTLALHDILNFMIILGKLCTWECRKLICAPSFNLFLYKVEVKRVTEREVATNNGTLTNFNKRWGLFLH